MANDFLNTVFEDRQLQLEDAIGNHNAGELSDIVEGFVTRTTVLKQEKFQATLDTVVACVAFKRLCGTGVGSVQVQCGNLQKLGGDQAQSHKFIHEGG